MKYLLALDQGTSSSRSIVFAPDGHIVAMAQREFRQIYPNPGWVEHDPLEIWSSQLATMREALQNAKLQARDIACVGITNQRETTVVWNRHTGQPIYNAIVWQDRRAEPVCARLREQGMAPAVQEKTGLIIDAYFSGTKLQWILDNVPGARDMAAKGDLAFGTVDTWLIWQITQGRVHATDVSNAARTMLMNVHTNQWDNALLAMLDIPPSLMPQIQPSSSDFGQMDAQWLGHALPIGGVAGDQQSALFGQACWSAGQAKNTYGTGCFMLMNTGQAAVSSQHQLITTVAWQGPAPACYALEGSVFMAGATVQWLRDGLQIIQQAHDVEALAGSVEDTGDVYLVPAFAGLGAPDWDGHARGTLVGMTRGTTRSHIARAALEAISLQSADVFHAMAQDSGLPLRELRVDGGASRNNLLMQLQADVLGVPVVRPTNTETTALGAAFLAGLAVGVWSGADDIAACWQVDRRFEPRASDAWRDAKRARWREAVTRARHWAS